MDDKSLRKMYNETVQDTYGPYFESLKRHNQMIISGTIWFFLVPATFLMLLLVVAIMSN